MRPRVRGLTGRSWISAGRFGLVWGWAVVAGAVTTWSATVQPLARDPLRIASIHEDLLPGVRVVVDTFAQATGWRATAQAVPYAAHEMWIRTQMLSGRPPDVLLVESSELPSRYGQAGRLVRWDDALSKPNRFDVDHPERPWQAAFHNELIHQGRDATGALWCIPYTQFGVGFFFNQAVYAQLKLAPPRTWEDMLTNFRAVRTAGHSALVTAIRPNDHQTLWMADMVLELLLRPVAAEVNLQAQPGWRYDALDPESTRGEVITLEERLVAFERGLIDPARAPAFRETARLMKELAAEFRPDFLSLDGEEVPRIFARGQSVHFLNGTWFLRPLDAVQKSIAALAPDRVFPWSVFPFPALTDRTTALPRLGGINQNSGLRACFVVPLNPGDPERERAAVDLVRFLTAPKVATESFGRTDVYDLPAIRETAPKTGAEPLVPRERYAYLTLALWRGYDARGESEFWTLWQGFLAGRVAEDQFLRDLSVAHRGALRRLAQAHADRLDRTLQQRFPTGGLWP
ncbi:MAG: ABC transporter substrate-binding protein [Opitutaceae bacterium]